MTNLFFVGLLVTTGFAWSGQKCANGRWPTQGVTCAAPRWIPFGTWLLVDGIGWRRVDDRLNVRFERRGGPRVDVYDPLATISWGNSRRRIWRAAKGK